MVEIKIAYLVYAVIGLGAVVVGIHRFTGIFKPKCQIDSCPDPGCQETVKGLKQDVSEMKPKIEDVQKDTEYIRGQVDILVKKMG